METYEFTKAKIAADKVATAKLRREQMRIGAVLIGFAAVAAGAAYWFFGSIGALTVVMFSIAMPILYRATLDAES